jgi:hypothetical protein
MSKGYKRDDNEGGKRGGVMGHLSQQKQNLFHQFTFLKKAISRKF